MSEVFKSSGLAFKFDPVQDRICTLMYKDQNHIELKAWMTRRFVNNMLPKLSSWLEERDEKAAVGEAKQENMVVHSNRQAVSRFEHHKAQQQVPSATESVPNSQIAEVDSFLINGMRLQERGGRVVLWFIDDKSSVRANMVLSRGELHKVLGTVIRVAENAQWQIENPWSFTSVVGASAATMQ
ncbi:MAG: hypothetical protein MI864_04630 [Pseudomonadales bacterium]|nr:hypothetical protein [Pseudomonadales bacterium]